MVLRGSTLTITLLLWANLSVTAVAVVTLFFLSFVVTLIRSALESVTASESSPVGVHD